MVDWEVVESDLAILDVVIRILIGENRHWRLGFENRKNGRWLVFNHHILLRNFELPCTLFLEALTVYTDRN